MGGILHRGVGAASMVVAGMLLTGCPSAADFDCSEDSQCTLESVMGTCEPNRWCSIPAPECDSGRRYGEQAGQGLAGLCVDPGGSTGTQGDPTTAGPDPATSSSAEPSTSSTTDLPDETGEVPTTSSGTSTGEETAGSSSSTGSPEAGFFDDFDRADSPELGNGWVERTPAVWALQGDRVVYTGPPASYEDSVFYRPFDEARLDLETSVEFTFVDPVDTSTPQLHARIQEDALSEPGQTNAYLVYMPAADDIVLTRVEGDAFALSASVVVDPPIQMGERYRLTLRVTGTDPVELFGSLERFDAEISDWSTVQTVSLTDVDDTRIVAPGSFGSSGSFVVAFEYDNFTMTPL